MKRSVIASFLAVGALASAQSFAATYYGDENDTSWLPHANANQESQVQLKSQDKSSRPNIVRYGDENDTSWLPAAAKR